MKKLEIITRPEKLEDLKELLNEREIYGMTVTMVNGCGQQKGKKAFFRGTEITINLLPKVKVEIVLPDDKADELITPIMERVRTGNFGDGKIFVYECKEAYRIRTGETGDAIL